MKDKTVKIEHRNMYGVKSGDVQKLIERIKVDINTAEEYEVDRNSRSWGMEEGILLSITEAKTIIKLITNRA